MTQIVQCLLCLPEVQQVPLNQVILKALKGQMDLLAHLVQVDRLHQFLQLHQVDQHCQRHPVGQEILLVLSVLGSQQDLVLQQVLVFQLVPEVQNLLKVQHHHEALHHPMGLDFLMHQLLLGYLVIQADQRHPRDQAVRAAQQAPEDPLVHSVLVSLVFLLHLLLQRDQQVQLILLHLELQLDLRHQLAHLDQVNLVGHSVPEVPHLL